MKQIIELIKKNQVTLFLGAGSSSDVGGPSGGDLLDEIKLTFPDVEFENPNNFFSVCQDIIESGKYGRDDLEKFVKKTLEGLYPNTIHSNLINIPWKCVFTTNYDTVIERIPINLQKRRIRQIKEKNPYIDYRRRDLLYLIKIFGSIDSEYGDEGNPVLTQTDLKKSYEFRRVYYNYLNDFIRYGPVLFIGYSFKDRLIFDLMSEIQDTIGVDAIRPSYAILPNEPNEKTMRLFKKYNINYVKGTLEEFVKLAETEFKHYSITTNYSEKTVHVHGYPIDIPIQYDYEVNENFIYLNNASHISKNIDIRPFFLNEENTFAPFSNNWDFLREIYTFDKTRKIPYLNSKITEGLRNYIVVHSMKKTTTESNEIILLTGPAGSGKSTILKRLAWDWYTSGLPVIFFRPQNNYVDYKQIDSFIQYLEENTKKIEASKWKGSRLRCLIICDHCANFIIDYQKLFDYLFSRGRLVTMIFSDRDNYLDSSLKNRYLTYTIPETISDAERDGFKKYLYEHNIIESDAELFALMDNEEINESFFALMYTIIHETRKPLNQIIHDQYQNLKDKAKEVYSYVCLCNNFDVLPNEELLVRCCYYDYYSFKKEIDEGSLNKVIFPVDFSDENPNSEESHIDYRVHHPIIAQRTIKIEFKEPNVIAQKIIELINHSNPEYPHELNKIENLLINGIGPHSHFSLNFPDNLKKNIFKNAVNKIKTRPVYHHYALLEIESETKNFEKAESFLKIAEHLKGSEKDEFLYTTYGKLYSQWGYLKDDEKKPDEAIKFYKMAEDYFIKGRTVSFKNTYAYVGQIALNKRRAEKTLDRLEKIKFLEKAATLSFEALNIVNDGERESILNLQLEVFNLLGDSEQLEEISKELAGKYQNPAGYRLKIAILYDKYLKADPEKKKEIIPEILRDLNLGLMVDDVDGYLLKIQAYLYLDIFKDDDDKIFEALKKWHDFSNKKDIRMLFNYGMILFKKELYHDSEIVFSEVNRQSQGMPNRSAIINAITLQEKGTNIFYEGIVELIIPEKNEAYLKCKNLPNLKTPIKSFPPFIPKQGQHVKFNISFNYRGLLATNVSPD
jgi:hypothetical protein